LPAEEQSGADPLAVEALPEEQVTTEFALGPLGHPVELAERLQSHQHGGDPFV